MMIGFSNITAIIGLSHNNNTTAKGIFSVPSQTARANFPGMQGTAKNNYDRFAVDANGKIIKKEIIYEQKNC